jgi:uncharacterized protein (DUF1778 family)
MEDLLVARLAKGDDTSRVLVQAPKSWIKKIDQAAKKAKVSRSRFIIEAAYTRAQEGRIER